VPTLPNVSRPIPEYTGDHSSSILMIAAEASSCMYAKMFVAKWLESFPETSFFGIGDKELQSQGMECQGLAEDLAVVGLQEVISHFPEIRRTFNHIVDLGESRKPAFALLFDYPGFNLRLAKKLKDLNIPIVYYISPQLWAWKKGRVEQVRKYVDEMLVVFPFEVDFYKEHRIEAHFVGHPLVEVITAELSGETPEPPQTTFQDSLTLGLMPGSRRSEIKFNLSTQVATAKSLKSKHPDLKVQLLLAPTLDVKFIEEKLGPADLAWIEIVQGKPTQMIADCDLILSASGTATLQVALCRKPMVVMYRMNAVTAYLAKRLVNTVDYFCIVNLIAGREIVPECFQESANPENLSAKLHQILSDESYRSQMISDLENTVEVLGGGGATENVFQLLKSKFGKSF